MYNRCWGVNGGGEGVSCANVFSNLFIYWFSDLKKKNLSIKNTVEPKMRWIFRDILVFLCCLSGTIVGMCRKMLERGRGRMMVSWNHVADQTWQHNQVTKAGILFTITGAQWLAQHVPILPHRIAEIISPPSMTSKYVNCLVLLYTWTARNRMPQFVLIMVMVNN